MKTLKRYIISIKGEHFEFLEAYAGSDDCRIFVKGRANCRWVAKHMGFELTFTRSARSTGVVRESFYFHIDYREAEMFIKPMWDDGGKRLKKAANRLKRLEAAYGRWLEEV